MLDRFRLHLTERYFEFFFPHNWAQLGARYLLLGFLFYGPWAFGSTRPALVDFLEDGLFLCLALHLAGLVIDRRLPRYPIFPTICFVLLLLQSLWMWFNSHSYHDDTYWEFVPLSSPFPQWPGSCDKAVSLFTLKNVGAMASVFLVGSDLIADPVWKPRLWRTMAIAGLSVILYGLLLKGLGSDSPLSMYHEGNLFFGPFRYHGNAGAYLNLIWPIFLALLVQSWSKRGAYVERAFWSAGLLMGIVACFINTSKAGGIIAASMLLMAGFAFATHFQAKLQRMRYISRAVVLGLLFCFLAIVIYSGTTSQIQERWAHLMSSPNIADAEGRTLVAQACLRMLPEAGWWGFGPGTFSTVFPYHTMYLGNKIPGFWRYAHEDYLQTAIEYGIIGSAIWSALFFGGLVGAIFRGLNSSFPTTDRIIYRASSLALGSVALHSLVDFPLQVASLQLYVMLFLAYGWSVPEGGQHAKRPRKDWVS